MNQTPVWLIVLFSIAGVIGLLGFILALGALGLFALAIIDGIRARNRGWPSRFRRLSGSDSVDRETLDRIAVKIGFEVKHTVPVDLQVAVESLLGICQVLDLLQRKVSGGTFSLCNVRREETRRAGGRDNSYTWTLVQIHTMVIFDADKPADFPPMGLNPKRPELLFRTLISIGRGICRITKWFGGRWDRTNLLPDNPMIRFPDDPEFHEKIWVGATVPGAAIPLLSTAARQVLKENADLTITANKRHVIVYEHGAGFQIERPPGPDQERIRSEVLVPEDWPQFCQAAVRVINALRKSEAQTRQQRPSRKEIEARLAKITGSRLRPDFQPLPQAEIEQFLRHPRPRPISKAVGRASRSTFSTGAPVSYAVLLIPMIGAIIWVMSVVWELGSPKGRIVGVSLGGVFVLAGLITFVALIVKTIRRRSLLKRGIVMSAQITKIKKSQDAITVDHTTWRKYRVTFRYSFRNEQYESTISVYGEQSQRAVDLQSSKSQSRILVSPTHPQRIFWIDGLMGPPNFDDRKLFASLVVYETSD